MFRHAGSERPSPARATRPKSRYARSEKPRPLERRVAPGVRTPARRGPRPLERWVAPGVRRCNSQRPAAIAPRNGSRRPAETPADRRRARCNTRQAPEARPWKRGAFSHVAPRMGNVALDFAAASREPPQRLAERSPRSKPAPHPSSAAASTRGSGAGGLPSPAPILCAHDSHSDRVDNECQKQMARCRKYSWGTGRRPNWWNGWCGEVG